MQREYVVPQTREGGDNPWGAHQTLEDYLRLFKEKQQFDNKDDAGRLPEREALYIALSIVQQLRSFPKDFAHGDITTKNIFVFSLSGSTTPPIIEATFELGCVAPQSLRKDNNRYLDVEGSPSLIYTFDSPQLLEEHRNITAESDIFAVVCLLFLLLTGRPAFAGSSEAEVNNKLEKCLDGDLEEVDAALQGYSQGVRALVKGVLGSHFYQSDQPQHYKDPLEKAVRAIAKRSGNAESLWQELKQYTQGPIHEAQTLIGKLDHRKSSRGECYTPEGCPMTGTQCVELVKNEKDGKLYVRKKCTKNEVLISKCDHPNIVKCADVYSSNGESFIILEYMEGGSLQDYINKKRKEEEERQGDHDANESPRRLFSVQEAVYITLSILNALKYLSSHKISHGDITPANILLTDAANIRRSAIKLVDFGASKQLHKTNEQRLTTAPYSETGWYFVAPEQIIAINDGLDRPYNLQADVWAAGCLSYYLLMGKQPFRGSSINELNKKILNLQ